MWLIDFSIDEKEKEAHNLVHDHHGFRRGTIGLHGGFFFGRVLQETKGGQDLGKNGSNETLRLVLGTENGPNNGGNGRVENAVVQAMQLVQDGRVEAVYGVTREEG